jgi:SWI/SNF-related matrix-associated actin-dependent regulator of chromatin subfamily A member 5
LHELWALLSFLLPDVFVSAAKFDKVFDLERGEEKEQMITNLHKVLRPFMLRRLKSEVAKTLPAKRETFVFCSMSQMQRNLYKGILQDNRGVVAGLERSLTGQNNVVMQLRKACNHPYLFPGMEDRDLNPQAELLALVGSGGKLEVLDKMLTKLHEKGRRVLIFSQMTAMLDILQDLLIMRRYHHCRLDGETPTKERQELIDDFNALNSDKFVFLLSTRAGGLGINLQTADTVILFDR